MLGRVVIVLFLSSAAALRLQDSDECPHVVLASETEEDLTHSSDSAHMHQMFNVQLEGFPAGPIMGSVAFKLTDEKFRGPVYGIEDASAEVKKMVIPHDDEELINDVTSAFKSIQMFNGKFWFTLAGDSYTVAGLCIGNGKKKYWEGNEYPNVEMCLYFEPDEDSKYWFAVEDEEIHDPFADVMTPVEDVGDYRQVSRSTSRRECVKTGEHKMYRQFVVDPQSGDKEWKPVTVVLEEPEVASASDEEPLTSASGDPHISNIFGERFDIKAPGNFKLLLIPKEVTPDKPVAFRIDAEVLEKGGDCNTLFMKSATFAGSWLSKAANQLELKLVQKQGVSVLDARGLTKEESNNVLSVNENQAHLNVHGLKVFVQVQYSGCCYAYLNLKINGLREAVRDMHTIGGLLGGEDYAAARTVPPSCKQSAFSRAGHSQANFLLSSMAAA